MWQDWVISAVSWAFVISLVPTILHKAHKPSLATSILTGIGMAVMTATYLSLGLVAATLSASLVAVEWFILAWQRWRLDRAAPGPSA